MEGRRKTIRRRANTLLQNEIGKFHLAIVELCVGTFI